MNFAIQTRTKGLVMTKGETITLVSGNISFFAGKRLQYF